MRKFKNDNAFPNETFRAWARRYGPYLPESGTYSEVLAMCVFILMNGRTQCHYHTSTDRMSETNNAVLHEDPEDEDLLAPSAGPSDPSSAAATAPTERVTGVPFPYLLQPLKNPSYLRRGPKDRVVGPNPNLTYERVLEFFPVVNGTRVMHCGCVLEDALFDFYCWKATTLKSITYPDVPGEMFKRAFTPRTRLLLSILADSFVARRRDLYEISRNGKEMTEIKKLKNHKHAISKRLARVIEEEEQREAERLQKDGLARYVELDSDASE